jgi:hypothetical protein
MLIANIRMNIDQDAFTELCYYTLSQADASFIHQLVVDAFAAQTWEEGDKPIKLAFALVGLFLHVEKGFTGMQVQLVHMQLARKKQPWPDFFLPANRGTMTVNDVIAVTAGAGRDEMIHRWCRSVWEACNANRPIVANLLSKNDII